MMLQVVGKIQKEMAEKKLTSDFETVAKHIINVIIISTVISTVRCSQNRPWQISYHPSQSLPHIALSVQYHLMVI